VLASCASQTPPLEPVDVAAPPKAVDAVPQVYAEQEVDVVARPLAPLRPRYPARLRELGVEGSVEARVIVWPDGSVSGRELVASDHPEFTDSVREALVGARFSPGLYRGEPVASVVTLRLHFRLDR
jgi:TonB family protein